MPVVWTAVSLQLRWRSSIRCSTTGSIGPGSSSRNSFSASWPALVVMRSAATASGPVAGVVGGLVGGLLMPCRPSLWSLATGHGIWYPVNLLAGMVLEGMDTAAEELTQFNADWFVTAVVIHASMSLGLGLLYGFCCLAAADSRPLAWGGC